MSRLIVRAEAAALVSVLVAGCSAGSSLSPSATPSGAISSATAEPSAPDSGPMPPACLEATLAYDPSSEAMLLINCVDQFDQSSVEQIWAWDGAAWELIEDHGPPATVVTGVAFDPEGGSVLRYGGLPFGSNDCVPETWEWSQGAWSQLETDPPAACDHMFLVRDTTRDLTLLFGGGDDAQNLIEETWAWDGTGWQLLTDEGPAGRAHFGFLFDAAHDQALLYGGYDGNQVFGDFWAWDGTTWTEIDFPGPGARSHFGWAQGTDELLLFGGADSTSTFTSLHDDTWRLTNGHWTELLGEGPSTRGSPAFGYDAGRDVYVLYGGFDADGGVLADTWEWDGEWRCVTGC